MDFEHRAEAEDNVPSEFPRSVPENCAEYLLFILDNTVGSHTLLSALENVRHAAMQLSHNIAKGYIWQRDSFQLHLERDQGLVYLRGITDYGDSVEDEWLIVYLLRELTKSFPTLWVRVFDSDGEFLLIEAARVLPSWLSPEMDANRVWIHDGSLYVHPLAASSGVKRPLSLQEAVAYIQSNPRGLVQPSLVEAESFYRLEKYPGQIAWSAHHSQATLPRKLAYILHEKPSTIAPAVEAFYLRDPTGMKSLSISSGKAHFPPKDLVTVGVKFTKVLFAQLKSQPLPQAPGWRAFFEAAEKHAYGPEDDHRRLARLELGMKVTSGFELLAANARKSGNRLAREFTLLLEDLEEDGVQVLPTNEELTFWEDADREDDESWLDIDFEDFGSELRGSHSPRGGSKSGFGDSSAHANLRKIVSRFEAFLEDERAGIGGAEMENTGEVDDKSSREDSEGDEEGDDIDFDEDMFSRMMRETMGLPDDQATGGWQTAEPRECTTSPGAAKTNDEDEGIRQLTAQMEIELKKYGALRLDQTPERMEATRATGEGDLRGKEKSIPEHRVGDEDDSEEVDVDYNLAKNILESFRSQGGMAGPTSNLLGMMGIQLPRDEAEDS
ncbi:SGT1-domain-containing protein [Durotheca rogersii]|uniref:SGT1-domain-containing protein n=1 Tax=Durotheca rogersii TaxID=419775 RepID=UPI00221F05D6|nr:SGT1-domain-containing protein [Durotheca rogersii]KAI5854103.1 SGT1-domain-containing protein [Durotheca rogersii]